MEPLDMRNFPECTLQVLEMQDGDGITNVYCGIWEPSGFTQRLKGTAKYAKEPEVSPTFFAVESIEGLVCGYLRGRRGTHSRVLCGS